MSTDSNTLISHDEFQDDEDTTTLVNPNRPPLTPASLAARLTPRWLPRRRDRFAPYRLQNDPPPPSPPSSVFERKPHKTPTLDASPQHVRGWIRSWFTPFTKTEDGRRAADAFVARIALPGIVLHNLEHREALYDYLLSCRRQSSNGGTSGYQPAATIDRLVNDIWTARRVWQDAHADELWASRRSGKLQEFFRALDREVVKEMVKARVYAAIPDAGPIADSLIVAEMKEQMEMGKDLGNAVKGAAVEIEHLVRQERRVGDELRAFEAEMRGEGAEEGEEEEEREDEVRGREEEGRENEVRGRDRDIVRDREDRGRGRGEEVKVRDEIRGRDRVRVGDIDRDRQENEGETEPENREELVQRRRWVSPAKKVWQDMISIPKWLFGGE